MKRWMSLLLITVMILMMFSGCRPDDIEGGGETVVLKTPNAMASFGNSPVAGV